jgi:hypothetical protein
MSFFDCVQSAIDDPEVAASRERGERAQAMWRDISDQYERQGHPRHTAEALAAEDVKASFKKEYGEKRNRFLATVADQRKALAEVEKAQGPYLVERVETLHFEAQGIYRMALSMIDDYTRQINRKIFGGLTNPERQLNVMREMKGQATGDEPARILASAINRANEELRLWANELGANIGFLDDFGTRHTHDRLKIVRAGFDQWFEKTRGRIDWTRVNDPLTGRPLQAKDGPPPPITSQRSFLNTVYKNIDFGRNTDDAVYGRPRGESVWRRLGQERVLHFKTADDWIDYNKEFGSATPHQAIIGHIRGMSQDIAAMRAFGPNPSLGLDFRAQVQIKKAKDANRSDLVDKLTADANHAGRVFRVVNGAPEADSQTLAQIAAFMSSTRHVLSSAFLDRAIIASLSDANTIRVMADTIGANGWRVIGQQVGIVQSMSKDDMLRAKWVVDTQADPGAAMERWMQDVPPSGWAEQLSSTAMRIQGLSAWTDRARFMWSQTEWGEMAKNAGRPLSEVDPILRRRLMEHGITADEWDALRDPSTIFTAENGATFLVPAYWREATSLPPARAREIQTKVQTMIERSMETAVPTQSPVIRAIIGEGDDSSPGSLMYELRKSGQHMKSFVMAFTRAQYTILKNLPDNASRSRHAANVLVGATVMGAVSLQLAEIVAGRDPQPIDNAGFWARAVARGGGLGPLTDLVSAADSPFGGVASYLVGPTFGASQDVLNLTLGNATQATMQLLGGEPIDMNFPAELRRFLGRYTPMADTPLIGPAFQRMVLDEFYKAIDPDAMKDLETAAKRRQNLYGNAEWWKRGSPVPERAPDLASMLGR